MRNVSVHGGAMTNGCVGSPQNDSDVARMADEIQQLTQRAACLSPIHFPRWTRVANALLELAFNSKATMLQRSYRLFEELLRLTDTAGAEVVATTYRSTRRTRAYRRVGQGGRNRRNVPCVCG